MRLIQLPEPLALRVDSVRFDVGPPAPRNLAVAGGHPAISAVAELVLIIRLEVMTRGRDASDTANVVTGTARARPSIGAGWRWRRNSRESTFLQASPQERRCDLKLAGLVLDGLGARCTDRPSHVTARAVLERSGGPRRASRCRPTCLPPVGCTRCGCTTCCRSPRSGAGRPSTAGYQALPGAISDWFFEPVTVCQFRNAPPSPPRWRAAQSGGRRTGLGVRVEVFVREEYPDRAVSRDYTRSVIARYRARDPASYLFDQLGHRFAVDAARACSVRVCRRHGSSPNPPVPLVDNSPRPVVESPRCVCGESPSGSSFGAQGPKAQTLFFYST